MRMATQPDPVANLDMRNFRTDIDHRAGRFMPADKGKQRRPPDIVAQAEIGMAQSAMFDLYIDIIGPQRPEFIFKRFKFAAGLWRGISFDSAHNGSLHRSLWENRNRIEGRISDHRRTLSYQWRAAMIGRRPVPPIHTAIKRAPEAIRSPHSKFHFVSLANHDHHQRRGDQRRRLDAVDLDNDIIGQQPAARLFLDRIDQCVASAHF